MKEQAAPVAAKLPPLTLSRREEIELPGEPEIERGILGALALREDPAQVIQVSREVHRSAFTQPGYRQIFDCLVELALTGAVNLMLLVHLLRTKGSTVNAADVAALVDGVPRLSDLSREIQIIKDVAARREIIRCADSWSVKAQARDVDIRELSRGIAERALEFGQTGAMRLSLATPWGTFKNEAVREGELIAFGLERRETGSLIALPNAGKSTISLNAALALAVGRRLAPVVIGATPRRVLLIDGESSRAKLQRDLKWMMKDFSEEEKRLGAENIHIICEAEIGGEPLSLAREDHLSYVLDEAAEIKPDFIVIDTQAALFPVFNENDNAEQQRKVWRPLQKLARQVDAAVLVLHHIGKRSDDEQSNDRKFYRGRGASAGGGAVRTAWTLTQDQTMRDFFTLACTKMKGVEPEETRFQLGSDRWMRPIVGGDAPKVPEMTAVNSVVNVVTYEMKTGEIKALLRGKLAERTVEMALTEAHQRGLLRYVRKGWYAPPAKPATLPLADDAEDAEGDKKEAISTNPQNPQAPKGDAGFADDSTASHLNGLQPKPQNRKNGALRIVAEAKKVIEHPQNPHSPIGLADIADGREVVEL